MDPNNDQPRIIPPQETPDGDFNPLHKTHVAPVRSFSSDLANAIREKGGSVVRIAIAEEEKHQREFQENSATSRKNIVFIIATTLIVLGALGSIIWVYKYKKAEDVPIVQTGPVLPTSIINAEDAQVIPVSGVKPQDIVLSINAIVTNPNIESGTIKNIIIADGTGSSAIRLPANQFLNSLGMHAPDEFLRSLSKEYMLGTYLYDEGHLFLILKGTAHDFLLSGMIAWEQKLFRDMVPLFNIDTTSLTVAQLQTMPFNDMVIENHDVRAVVDAGGTPLFFYTFLDQNTIFMGTDSKTLVEAVRRF